MCLLRLFGGCIMGRVLVCCFNMIEEVGTGLEASEVLLTAPSHLQS